MNVYARTRDERLSEAVERVGEVVLSKPIRAPARRRSRNRNRNPF
jgi:hypothetical protein